MMKIKIEILVLFSLLYFSANCGAKENCGKFTPGFAKFNELPISAIQPTGWLKKTLETQRDGLTGHLENAKYPFDNIWWGADSTAGNKSIEKWWPYEQNGYWIDGMVRTGYLLNDKFLIDKSTSKIDYVLSHPDKDGYLGPRFMKASAEGDRWADLVFFRAVLAKYSATGDTRILKKLKQHYFSDHYPHSGEREVMNTEIMLGIYKQTGDTAILNWAIKVYNGFIKRADGKTGTPSYYLRDEPSEAHGVTYNELAKLGSLFYMATGDNNYLKPSVEAYKRIDKYHMMVDGVNVSSERLRTPVDALSGHETCDISDMTWTLGYLLMATSNVDYADKIERAMFNAAPGVTTSDFKALQYFSSVNQVIADKTSAHILQGTGGGAMSYSPNPLTECCPANVTRMMPNFAARLWMSDQNKGLVAAMYAPSTVTYLVGVKQHKVTIDEITTYPFSDNIEFVFSMKDITEFPFSFRIPLWCKKPAILLNGKKLTVEAKSGNYITINRKFSNKDKITLILPQEFKLQTSVDGGISVERGPLLFALKIDEDWQIDKNDKRSTPEFPAYNLYAKSLWNYALYLKPSNLSEQIMVVNKKMTTTPWSINTSPIELKVPAKLVNGWILEKRTEITEENWQPIRNEKGLVARWAMVGIKTVKGNYAFTPALPSTSVLPEMLDSKIEQITLVPFGCTKLRITIFPKAPVE